MIMFSSKKCFFDVVITKLPICRWAHLLLASLAISCDDNNVVRRPLSLASLVESGPNRRPPSDPARFTVLQLQKEINLKNIFVGNLSFNTTEDSVRALFEAYGTIDRVSIVTDRDTGQARGFGFVEMSNNAEGDRAIAELNGRDLDGRAINVNEARPKEDRGSGGGNRGRSGGGGQRSNRW
jgi:cold-inducible RNA-binding protein